ncbi:hypothetical protein [Variovorax paradoxus]|uniref:hypothetical protein n=1 Tax=Variovorax paradoxus TaxID=34073 RepID=UPI003D655459
MNANTHSRRAATAVTEAVTAVTKPHTSTTDTAPAPIENEPPSWRTAAYAARDKISSLLNEALCDSEEANELSTSWAQRLISTAITVNDTSGDESQSDIADTACNVEAVLQGLLSLSDDPVVPVVRAKLEHVIAITDAIVTFNPQEMAAVSEAAPIATAPTIADIRGWMVLADEKLEQAYDAAERGEYIDGMLDHICHSMLLEPLELIQRDSFTQFDAGRVYDRLFPVLAVIHGAIKIAEGTIIHHTLTEAFRLLDNAQGALDSATSQVRALPVDDDDMQESGGVASPAQPAIYDHFEISEVDCVVSEAIGIMEQRGEAANSNLVYGAILAAEAAQAALRKGMTAKSMDECADASGPLDVAADVLLEGLGKFDDPSLQGAWRLLGTAKERLDNEIARDMNARKAGVK